ncbi:MAG: hypothetical protein HUU23_12175 [Caldilineales bacterium]|nr:hypothetical protein [Caldilineales bacterium]
MKLSQTLKRILAGSAILGALALMVTLALPAVASAHGGPGGNGRGGMVASGGDSFLADALGISVEDLQTAQQAAADKAIDLAVEQGLITQAQADALKARTGGVLGHLGHFGMGLTADIDREALLAEALDISVEDLQAAQQAAHDAALAQAVEEGRITQEQADEMKARHALQTYLNGTDLQTRMQGLWQEAVQQAVENGVITQEQADQFLSQQQGFGLRGFDGMRGHGGMRGFDGMRGRGGMRGFGGATFFPGQSNSGISTTSTNL